METAKVDIRRLQILNDRINQCIDALNQVRLSVHGLSHANPGLPYVPWAGNPLPQGFGPGFSHTSPLMGSGPAFFPSGPPAFAPFPGTSSIPGINPYQGFNPYAGLGPLAGLSHTGLEEGFGRPAFVDPLLAVRIAQTFPYAQYPVPSVVTIF